MALISYIVGLIFFIKYDVSKHYNKFNVFELLSFIGKIDKKEMSLYLELMSLMSYQCNVIKRDSKKRHDDVDKVIARNWIKMVGDYNPYKHLDNYVNISDEIIKIYNDNKNDYKKIEEYFKEKNRDFGHETHYDFSRGIKTWLFNNNFLIINYVSLIVIFVAFMATIKRIQPLDTYLYGVASLLLIVFTILNDYIGKIKMIKNMFL